MKRFLALGLALSLPLAALPAHANVTGMSYDARALSLGGSFSAWGNQDINSPLGNPALLSLQRGTFFFGPNLGLNLGNNAVGTNEIQGLLDYAQYISAYQAAAADGGTPPSAVPFPDVLPDDGLRLFAGTQVGLVGLKIGNLGIRSYVRGGVEGVVSAPAVFAVLKNFDATDRNIASELEKLNANLSSNSPDFNAVATTVGQIKDHLTGDSGFGPLMKQDANDSGERKVTVAVNEQAYMTTGVTYAQEIGNFGLPGKLTAGATVKLFNGIGTMNFPGNTFQTSDNRPVPLGVPGRLEITTKMNVAQPLADMNQALDDFAKNPTENASAFSSAADKFSQDMKSPDSFKTMYTSYAAGSMGTGLDLGLTLAVNDALTVGGAVTNALVFWPGTKSVYEGGYNGSSFQLVQQGKTENINFTDTEPLGLQVGAALATPIPGLMVAADVQQNFDGYGPSLQVGAEENLFNLLALRVGGRFGGRYSFIGGGVGLNLWLTRVDLAAAFDPAGRSGNIAASWSLGF